VDLSNADLERFSKDMTKMGLPEEQEKWLLHIIEELRSIDSRPGRKGYIDGIILMNKLGPVSV
jgi:hypothetical protein